MTGPILVRSVPFNIWTPSIVATTILNLGDGEDGKDGKEEDDIGGEEEEANVVCKVVIESKV